MAGPRRDSGLTDMQHDRGTSLMAHRRGMSAPDQQAHNAHNVARSSYASPSQPQHQQHQRAGTLHEALARADADMTPTNPLLSPAAQRTHARMGMSVSPAGRLRTPKTDSARQRVDAAMRGSPFTSPFVRSPITRCMRQAPLGGSTPLGVKRKQGAPLDTPPSTRPRRTLGETLPQACLTDIQPSKRRSTRQQASGLLGLRQCPTFGAGTNLSAHCQNTLLEAPLSSSAHLSGAAEASHATAAGSGRGTSRGPRRSLQTEFDIAHNNSSRSLLSGDLSASPMFGTGQVHGTAAGQAHCAKPAGDAGKAAQAHNQQSAQSDALRQHSSSTDVDMDTGAAPIGFATDDDAAPLPQAAAAQAMGAAQLQQQGQAVPASAAAYCRSTMQLAAAVQSSIERSARRRLAAMPAPPLAAQQAPAPAQHAAPSRPPLPPGATERLPARLPSVTGAIAPLRSTTPTAASPTSSVCTPAGAPPPTLQVPGAPMKKGRILDGDGAGADALAGRISSLSMDSLDATGVSTLSSASPCWSPREGSPRACRPFTRRMLVFPDLPAGTTP